MVEKCINTVKKSDQFDLTRAGETGQSFWNGGSILLLNIARKTVLTLYNSGRPQFPAPRCEVGAATVVVGRRIHKLQLVSLGLVVLGLFSLVINKSLIIREKCTPCRRAEGFIVCCAGW